MGLISAPSSLHRGLVPQLPAWGTEEEALSLYDPGWGVERSTGLDPDPVGPNTLLGSWGRALQSQKRLEPEVTEVGGAGSPLSALAPSGPFSAHPRGS